MYLTRLTVNFVFRLPFLVLTTVFTLMSFVAVTPTSGFVWVRKT